MVRKPSSTNGRMAAATTSGGPRSVRPRPPSGMPLWSQIALNARSAAARSSRTTAMKLTDRSIVAGSRPRSAQCRRSAVSWAATSSNVPVVFQASARRATMRSVFRGPEPPPGSGGGPGAAAGDDGVDEPVVPALVGDALPVEEAADDPDGLVQPVQPLPEAGSEVDPERLVLAGEPRPAEAEDRPSAAHVVEGGGQLRHVARRPERVGGRRGARPGRATCGRPRPSSPATPRTGAGPAARRSREVVPRPDGVEAGLLGGDGGAQEGRPVGRLAPQLGSETDVGHVSALEVLVDRRDLEAEGHPVLGPEPATSASTTAGSSGW